jgi:hypothetical protein
MTQTKLQDGTRVVLVDPELVVIDSDARPDGLYYLVQFKHPLTYFGDALWISSRAIVPYEEPSTVHCDDCDRDFPTAEIEEGGCPYDNCPSNRIGTDDEPSWERKQMGIT